MRIGVPKEIKLQEYRIGLTPESVKVLTGKGYEKTLKENKNYLSGLNVFKGTITCKGVADAFKLKYTPADKALQN